jgi:tRNA dimethylallyltransferase
MIEAGFLNEVKGLLGMGYSEDLKSMQSIGYRHLVDFIKGRCSWDEAIRTLKRDTRRYAKRQLTWFKADPMMVWTEPGQIEEIRGLIKNFLQVE